MDLLFSKIYKTFVFQDRYLLFLEGFRNTIILTILSFICGILFGILISFAVSSKNEPLRKSVTFIRSLLIEIPTMVLLMIFVYLIFGDTNLIMFYVFPTCTWMLCSGCHRFCIVKKTLELKIQINPIGKFIIP